MQRNIVRALAVLVAMACAVALSWAQNQSGKPPVAAAPAHAADVASRDAIVRALYGSISGPAGTRDWDRFRRLFIPEAQLIAAFKKKDASIAYHAIGVQVDNNGTDKYIRQHGYSE